MRAEGQKGGRSLDACLSRGSPSRRSPLGTPRRQENRASSHGAVRRDHEDAEGEQMEAGTSRGGKREGVMALNLFISPAHRRQVAPGSVTPLSGALACPLRLDSRFASCRFVFTADSWCAILPSRLLAQSNTAAPKFDCSWTQTSRRGWIQSSPIFERWGARLTGRPSHLAHRRAEVRQVPFPPHGLHCNDAHQPGGHGEVPGVARAEG